MKSFIISIFISLFLCFFGTTTASAQVASAKICLPVGAGVDFVFGNKLGIEARYEKGTKRIFAGMIFSKSLRKDFGRSMKNFDATMSLGLSYGATTISYKSFQNESGRIPKLCGYSSVGAEYHLSDRWSVGAKASFVFFRTTYFGLYGGDSGRLDYAAQPGGYVSFSYKFLDN